MMILPTKCRVRVEGALSDLHAADVRYHVNCMASFMSPKSISAAKNASKEDENTDPAFDEVIGEILNVCGIQLNCIINTSYLAEKHFCKDPFL